MNLEICVDNLESVHVCAEEGVGRIELCACLADGGLTPSLGFLNAARRIFPGKIVAMLRPRGGDFYYSEGEIRMMMQDADLMAANGADGIVFGVLQPDGQVDRGKCGQIISHAAGLDTVFHRAIDVSRDPLEALEVLISLGIRRVLTSGGEEDVHSGAVMLRKMTDLAAGRIEILAGGGLKIERLAELVGIDGLEGIHLSARKPQDGPMVFRHVKLDFSPPGGSDHVRMQASADVIRTAQAAMIS